MLFHSLPRLAEMTALTKLCLCSQDMSGRQDPPPSAPDALATLRALPSLEEVQVVVQTRE